MASVPETLPAEHEYAHDESTSSSSQDIESFLPLPSDLSTLSETETACQYCGISYLLLTKYNRMTTHVQNLEKELQDLKQYVSERKDLMRSLEVVRRAREKDGERMRQMEGEMEGCKSEIKTLVEFNETLRMRNEKLVEQVEEKDRTVDALTRGSEKVKREVVTLKSDFENEVMRFKEHQSEIRTLFDTTRTKFISHLTESQTNHNTKLRSLEQKYEFELRAKAALLSDVERQKCEALTKASELSDRVQVLEESNTKLMEENANLKASYASTAKELNSVRAECMNANHRVKAVTNEKDQLEFSLQEVQTRHEALGKQFTTLEQEHHDLISQYSNLQSQLTSRDINTSTALSQKDEQVFTLQTQVKHLQTRLQTLQTEHTSTIEAHQNRVKQLQDKFLEDIKRAGELEAQKKEQELREWFEEREKLVKKEEADRVRKVYEEQRKDLQLKVDHLRQEMEKLNNDHKVQSESWFYEKQSLQSQLSELQESHLAEVKSLQSEIEQLKSTTSQTQSTQESLSLQWSQEKQALQSEIQFLKETVKDQCEERMGLVTRISDLKALLSSHQGPLHASLDKVDSRMGSLGSLSSTNERRSSSSVDVSENDELQRSFEAKAMKAKHEKDRKMARYSASKRR